MDITELLVEPILDEEFAIELGRLHHLWPNNWPWLLVTDGLLRKVLKEETAYGAYVFDFLLSLVDDAVSETCSQLELNPSCTFVQIENTVIGEVWIRPNTKGGMTISLPENN